MLEYTFWVKIDQNDLLLLSSYCERTEIERK